MKKYFFLLIILLIVLPPVGFLVDAQVGSFIGNSPVWQDTANLTVFAGQSTSFKVEARDPNGDSLTYYAVQLPANASFNAQNQSLSFSPTIFQVGTQQVVLSVTDYKTPPVENRIFINVIDNNARTRGTSGIIEMGTRQSTNVPPMFTSIQNSYAVNVGEKLEFSVFATDADNDFLTFAASQLPVGARFNNLTRVFSWTPQVNQAGIHRVLFQVGDGYGHGTQTEININVAGGSSAVGFFSENSSAPQFTSSPATFASAGSVYEYQVRSYDLENDAVVYRIVSGPTGAVIDQRSGLIRWYPGSDQYGQSHYFAVGVTDGKSAERVQEFTVSVSGSKVIVVNQPAEVSDQQVSLAGVTTYMVNKPYVVTAANSYAPIAQVTPLTTFGITVRSNERNEVLVSWLNNQEASGEVVFGTSSYPENAAQIWNYDFTSGEQEATTRHEINLGQLQQQRTYYLRVISRLGSQMEVTRELAFVPFAVSQTPVMISQNQEVGPGSYLTGAASVFSTAGLVTLREYAILFLLLVVIALLVYLILRSARVAQVG